LFTKRVEGLVVEEKKVAKETEAKKKTKKTNSK
jgi:hypothetical protein